MTSRLFRVCAVTIALLASAPFAWAQYSPPRGAGSPPRSGSQSQIVPIDENPRTAVPRNPVIRSERSVEGLTPVVGPAAADPQSGLPGAMPNEQQIPCPFEPLTARQQEFLDKLLLKWEEQSGKIERYRCDFERWEYDPIFGPADPKQAKTYSTGKIRYAAPDKGLFKVEMMKVYRLPAMPGEEAQWLKKPADEIGEHWVCDGKRVFEFEVRKKQLTERPLPAEMQGKAIVDGPLPFLFGAKAEKIKARYWVRLITPSDKQEQEFWLEAVPKYRADAMNFKMVHVIVDKQDFLPKALQVFDPSFDPEKRPIRTVFTFNKREVNWSVTLESLNIFHREFYEPSTPFGWKKVIEPFIPEPGQQQPANPPAEAKRPSGPLNLLPFKLLK